MNKILVVSPPRSGSSVLSQLLETAGYCYPRLSPLCSESKTRISPSEYNAAGYNEDVALTLLNDQLIRLIYGKQFSFLHSPNASIIDAVINAGLGNIDFEKFYYDLDESTVTLPENYLFRLEELANHTWDVWGLSRMTQSGKWYKAYSRHNLANGQAIYNGLHQFSAFLQSDTSPLNIYIKDPRFIFSFPAFISALKSSSFSIVIIKRDSLGLLNSMRSHYGDRLFTNRCIDDFNFVSNHFNYKVEPQSFESYLLAINISIQKIKELGIPVLEISYDKIMKKESRELELSRLDSFIGAKVDSTILHTPS
jgi:hypothetical protein